MATNMSWELLIYFPHVICRAPYFCFPWKKEKNTGLKQHKVV